MLQARPKGTNDPFYAPHRDVAYMFPHLALAAMRGLDAGNWLPWYKEYLNHHGVTEDMLGEGARALALFCNGCTDEVEDTAAEHVLERSGFFALPKPVQFVIQAKLGQLLLGAYFMSIREVTHQGEAPPLDMLSIVKGAERAAYYMSMGPVRRSFSRGWDGLKRWVVNKLNGKEQDGLRLPKGPMPLAHQGLPAAAPLVIDTAPPNLPANLPLPGVAPNANP
jgi:hypothetical protein